MDDEEDKEALDVIDKLNKFIIDNNEEGKDGTSNISIMQEWQSVGSNVIGQERNTSEISINPDNRAINGHTTPLELNLSHQAIDGEGEERNDG